MHQYWKDDGLFELQEQHLAYQVRSILKTGKLSKVEIERLKRQIKQLHVDSVECETGELDRSDEEVVTQSDDNVLLQEFTAGASGCVEDTHVSESASDIRKRLKLLLKNPKNDPIPSLRSANAFQLKQETEMKENIRKEYFKRLRLTMKSKLNAKHESQAINTWVVPTARYSGGIIE